MNAFNGVTIGKGHLAEAKAAHQSLAAASARGAFSRKDDDHDHGHAQTEGGSCGTGDTTQRDELLAKIRDAKKIELKAD